MANQISYFNVKYMTVGACANFHTTVVKYITATTPQILHIENKIEAYREKVRQLESIVNRQRAYTSTGKLKSSDAVRDNAGGVVTGVIHLYLNSPVKAKREAAELLDPQVSVYRNIRRHEYSKQTAEVRGFLRLLDLPENQAAIETLGLTDEVEALRTANADFETYFDERALEAGARKVESNMKSEDLIDDANELYQGIAQIVNAYAIVEPSDEINEFITKMNGLIAAVENLAGSSSATKDENKTEGEEPTEIPDDTDDPTTGDDTENPDDGSQTEEPETPDTGDGEDSDTEEPDDNPSGPGIPNP